MRPLVRTERGIVRRVVVVGAGVSGLAATLELCAANVPVLLVSLAPARRSHSGCNSSGIYAGEGSESHLADTIAAGAFLAHQAPVKAMLRSAAGVVDSLTAIGVPFERTASGELALGGAVGTKRHATAYSGMRTGQRVLHALEEQVRRLETQLVLDEAGAAMPGEPRVRALEGWDFLSVVEDDNGAVVGVVLQDTYTMAVKAMRADAVCIATGGGAQIFGATTASDACTGAPLASLIRSGAVYANGELVQLHPATIAGPRKHRELTERCLAVGGRLWVPRDSQDARSATEIPERERTYALETDALPLGNLTPWSEATRALYGVGGISGRVRAFLDLTHVSPSSPDVVECLDAARRIAGVDPRSVPVPVTSAAHYFLGGLWTDFEANTSAELVDGSPRNHATSLPGVYAVGEACYQYHGAGALGCNVILSHVFAGRVAARAITSYRSSLGRSAFDLPGSIFERAEARELQRYEAMFSREAIGDAPSGRELHDRLHIAMRQSCGPTRDRDGLRAVLEEVESLSERSQHAVLADRGSRLNQTAVHARALDGMLTLAHVILRSALAREETRGVHARSDFPTTSTSAPRTTLARSSRDGSVEFLRGFSYNSVGTAIDVGDSVDVSAHGHGQDAAKARPSPGTRDDGAAA